MEDKEKLIVIREKMRIEEGTWEDTILLKWIVEEGMDKVYEEMLKIVKEIKKISKKLNK